MSKKSGKPYQGVDKGKIPAERNHHGDRVRLVHALNTISRSIRIACPKDYDRLPDFSRRGKPVHHSQLIQDAHRALEDIERAYNKHFGPRMQLECTGKVFETIKLGEPIILVQDFDGDLDGTIRHAREDLCPAEDYEEWRKPFKSAASEYRAECRWDFAPGCEGIWVIAVIPTNGWGGEEHGRISANLVGFAACYEREEVGLSMAHFWVATSERQKGIGSALLRKAREIGAVCIEHPITDLGRHAVKKVWPEQL